MWVVSPIAIAVYALFTNGSDYLVGGLVGVVSGPIAYLLVKRFYRGTANDALEGSVGMAAVSTEARRAHFALYRTLATSLAIVAGVVALALAFYIHSSHPWAVGGVWKIAGLTVSPQRLLAAMGLLMIVGGLHVQRSRTIGGILVAAAVVIALCLIYKHTDFRTTNVWVWSAPIVLATLGAVFAGLALKAEVEPVDLADDRRAARAAAGRRAARAARRGNVALGLIPGATVDGAGAGGRMRPRPLFGGVKPRAGSASSMMVTGSVVDESDPHAGAEDAGRDRHAGGAQHRHEGLVELFGLGRRRRAGEARPVAPAGVGVEGELRDGEQLAAGVAQREVHVPLVVVEDPQGGDLGGQPGRRGRRIVGTHSYEGEKTAAHDGHVAALDGHARLLDALQQHSHGRSLSCVALGAAA